MKAFNKLLLAGLFTMGLAACSDSNVGTEDTPTASADKVYMSFKLELPKVAGSRSATDADTDGDKYVNSTDGIEYGKDYENKVGSILVVLTNDAGNHIASSMVSGAEAVENSKDTYTASFQSTDLERYKNTNVNVYVYCNPQGISVGSFNKDAAYTFTGDNAPADRNASIWTNNQFMMSNAVSYATKLPKDYKEYNTKEKAFDLTEKNKVPDPIKVERSMARFDYKAGGKNGLYTLLSEKVDGQADKDQIQVTITEAALINMSKSFYFLRRVSNDGKNVNSVLCGLETATNYVVDTDANEKTGYAGTSLSSHFYYPLQEPNSWTWQNLSALQDDDTDDTWNNDTNNSKGDYKIWRYVTENTIPSTEGNQKNGISTGVVFKGQISATNDAPKNVQDAIKAGKEPIYVFDNVLYGTWNDVKTAATESTATDGTITYKATALGSAVELVEKARAEATTENADEKKITKAVIAAQAQAGFTGYSPTEDNNYYAYYYYWNRHNDNGKPTIMGTMEFAVVRNNVYKLCITNISKFGHPTPPTDPENPENPDPDPVDPNDPDESDDVYFKVSVQVLPWTVRINNIEF